MSWKEKRLITILSIILAVLCAAVLCGYFVDL